jgi:hypothetical protein
MVAGSRQENPIAGCRLVNHKRVVRPNRLDAVAIRKPFEVHRRDGRARLSHLLKTSETGDVVPVYGVNLLAADAAIAGIQASGRTCRIDDPSGTLIARLEGVPLADYWRRASMKSSWRAAITIED